MVVRGHQSRHSLIHANRSTRIKFTPAHNDFRRDVGLKSDSKFQSISTVVVLKECTSSLNPSATREVRKEHLSLVGEVIKEKK